MFMKIWARPFPQVISFTALAQPFPQSWDFCFYGWVHLGTDSILVLPVHCTECHQSKGIIFALKKFPVWPESWESGGGPSQPGQGGLVTSSMVSEMRLETSAIPLVIPGISGTGKSWFEGRPCIQTISMGIVPSMGLAQRRHHVLPF